MSPCPLGVSARGAGGLGGDVMHLSRRPAVVITHSETYTNQILYTCPFFGVPKSFCKNVGPLELRLNILQLVHRTYRIALVVSLGKKQIMQPPYTNSVSALQVPHCGTAARLYHLYRCLIVLVHPENHGTATDQIEDVHCR